MTYDSIITLKLLNIIHHFQKTPSAPLSSLSPLPTIPASCSATWHPMICFLSLHVSLHFLAFYLMNYIVVFFFLFFFFLVCYLSWAIILRFFHTVPCIKNPFLSLLNTPRSERPGSHGRSMLNFIKNLQAVFQRDCCGLTFPPAMGNILIIMKWYC